MSKEPVSRYIVGRLFCLVRRGRPWTPARLSRPRAAAAGPTRPRKPPRPRNSLLRHTSCRRGAHANCDGGLDRRALEVTYPASTGAAKSRTQATARERTQAGVLGSAYPSQVRAARGRSPASREGADQQPSLEGVSGSAGAGGKRAPGAGHHFPGTATAMPVRPRKRSARCGGNCGMPPPAPGVCIWGISAPRSAGGKRGKRGTGLGLLRAELLTTRGRKKPLGRPLGFTRCLPAQPLGFTRCLPAAARAAIRPQHMPYPCRRHCHWPPRYLLPGESPRGRAPPPWGVSSASFMQAASSGRPFSHR